MLRVGLIGCGGIAKDHLENVMASEIAEVVAVSDIRVEAADVMSRAAGAAAYTDYQSMLAKEQLDAVFICVPPFAHGEMEEHVAARDVHMLVEKPVGLELEQVHRKQRAIAESGIINATGYCLRYLDTVERIQAWLSGKTVALARGWYLTRFVEAAWWRKRSQSGGQIVEQATHIVDLGRYLLGEVAAVQSFQALYASGQHAGMDIPDVGVTNFRFQSGAVGHLSSTFLQTDHRMGLELSGDGFRLLWTTKGVTFIDDSGEMTYDTKVDMYKQQDDAFLQAVAQGNQSLVRASYAEAVQTLRLTLAINESADTGNIIELA